LIDLQNPFTVIQRALNFLQNPGNPLHFNCVAVLSWKRKNQKFALHMHVKHVSNATIFIIRPTDKNAKSQKK